MAKRQCCDQQDATCKRSRGDDELHPPPCSNLLNLSLDTLGEITKYLDHGDIAKLRRSCRYARGVAFRKWDGIRIYCQNFLPMTFIRLCDADGKKTTVNLWQLRYTSRCPSDIAVYCRTFAEFATYCNNWTSTCNSIRTEVNRSKLCVLMVFHSKLNGIQGNPVGGFICFMWKDGLARSPDEYWERAKMRYVNKHEIPLRLIHEVGEKALRPCSSKIFTHYMNLPTLTQDQQCVATKLHITNWYGDIWTTPDIAYSEFEALEKDHRASPPPFPPRSLWIDGKRAILKFYGLHRAFDTDEELRSGHELCTRMRMPTPVFQLLCISKELSPLTPLSENQVN